MNYIREPTLLGSLRDNLNMPPYFERAKNQYEHNVTSDFISLKGEGAKGDGVSDDTNAVQTAFNRYGDDSKITFVDAETYMITDTVTIFKDTKIVSRAEQSWLAIIGPSLQLREASSRIPATLVSC